MGKRDRKRTGSLRRTALAGLAVAAGLAFGTGPARADVARADPARGEALARQWCAACHLVDGAGTDAAPTFRAIARDPAKDPDHLRGFLAHPHGAMPPVPLGRTEIEDIIAYLHQLSLRP